MMLERDIGFQALRARPVKLALRRWLLLPAYFARRCGCHGLFHSGALAATLFLRDRLGALHVDSMAVLPPWRRMGIGHWLLERAQAIATSRRMAAMTLQVSTQNEAAVKLYTGFGFERGHGRALRVLGTDSWPASTANADVRVAAARGRRLRVELERLLMAEMGAEEPWTLPAPVPTDIGWRRRWLGRIWICEDAGHRFGMALWIDRRRHRLVWLCEPGRWGSDAEIAALAALSAQLARGRECRIQVASPEHHGVLRSLLGERATELEDEQVLMVKRLSREGVADRFP